MLKFFSISRAFFVLSSVIILLSPGVFAQTPKKTSRNAKSNLTKSKNPKIVLNEQDEFDKAVALADLNDKVKALEKFMSDFPKSEKKNEALEIIASIRAVWADEKLRAGDLEASIQLFKETISKAPDPIPEGLFANVILPIPNKLYFIGQQAEALKVATAIESKVKDDPKQLLGLATFYISIENAEGARMLAQSAINLDGTMPAAYQTLGLAYRLKFDLDEAEKSYAKALELGPDSVVSKRGLAEMKRAAGKSEEALAIYRELVEKDPNDATAQNGLILALFDAGQREEAEALLNKSLEADPKNLVLLVGAAYWYAANNEGAKAVDLGQKAVDLAPRYVWARIALARGQMAQKSPLEAEKTLLLAQKYGSFPTLDYELATARFQAGLFEEAARELKKRFAVKDGYVQTYLAGRTIMEAQSFTELLSLDRRATIFTPNAADSANEADKLKHLLDLSLKLANKEATEEEINQAADEFVKGDDRMKTHRQLYAASRLLDAKRSLPKVLELAQGAVKGVDTSLEVLNPSAAVLADELIESRSLAISKDEVVVIPEVPAQTLSRIIRGKIEELAGWALYQQDKPQEAIVRLKRAVSIAPDKSAWWRSSYWKLGLALDAGGNSKDSLDALVKSYLSGEPDRFRRAVIEGVYRKVNGNADGLEKLIGSNPFPETVAQVTETPAPVPTVEPSPDPTPAATPEIKAETAPLPEESPKAEPSPSPTVEATPGPSPEVTPTPIAETTPTPEPKTDPSPTPTVELTPSPTPEATPTAEIKETPSPTPKVEPTVPPKLEVKVEEMTRPKTIPTPVSRSLFDPVVIEVGKSNSAENKSSEKPTENTAENKEKPVENKEKVTEDSSRPRVVVEDRIELPSCVAVSQESISILGNGGNLGVLVGLTEDGDALKITAESSSPDDLQVSLESGIGRQSNRAFFVIRSVSAKKGVFTVSFTAHCGKKAIQVRVR